MSATATKPAAKTQCPVTKDQFLASATDVQVSIAGAPMLAQVKEFSTGSLGWYLSGKTVVVVDGVRVPVQVGVTLTCIGSKPQ